jgi:hypothetical protein
MVITKEFLESEIRDLEHEIQKANAFVLKAQGTIGAYSMLINRLQLPEPETETETETPLENQQ